MHAQQLRRIANRAHSENENEISEKDCSATTTAEEKSKYILGRFPFAR